MALQKLALSLIIFAATVTQANGSKVQHQLAHCRNPDPSYKRIEDFTVEWFQNNILDSVRHNKRYKDQDPKAPFYNALFYTRGMSAAAIKYACTKHLITIWEPWSSELYNESKDPKNLYSCIHHDNATRNTFFERMSEAFATQASGFVHVMHDPADYDKPPMDGIWGRVEQEVLRHREYVETISKLSGTDPSTIQEIWDRGMGWLVKYLPVHFSDQMELKRRLRRRAKPAQEPMKDDWEAAGEACPQVPRYTLHVDW